MKKIMYFKIAMVAVLGAVTILGCEKKEILEEETVTVDKSEQAFINELKIFMAKMMGVDVKEIQYEPKTQYFIWKGVNQLTKEQLLLAYEQSK